MFRRINGHLRPNLFAKFPINKLLIIMPAAFNDVTHDASASVIFPAGSGDSSEVNRKIAGLDQPVIMPMRNPIIDTMSMIRKEENVVSIEILLREIKPNF